VKLFARLAGVAAVLVAFLIYTEAEYYIVLGSIIALILIFYSYGKSPVGMLAGILLLMIFTGL
jgi:hypothetical protein